jgi:hypothetical protein
MPLLSPESPFFFRHRPRSVTGWLRAIFIEDWGLKLLALAITLFLWFSVTGQRTTTTVPLRHIPLSFRYASDLEINGEPRDVDITVTGGKSALDHLNTNELVAVVDISNLAPGERVVQLNRLTVTTNLPDGIRLDEVEPKIIPVHLEKRVERQLTVAPKLIGKPAPGFEVRSITTDPQTIQVRGAESRVKAIGQAETEPISIEGLSADRVFQQVAVTLSDSKLSLIDTVVNVTVHIGEARVERTLTGVKVVGPDGSPGRPATATITVTVDQSVAQALRADELQLVLDPAAVAGAAPAKRLVEPAALNGRIELKSTTPADFSVAK